jgi:hypothetical protein
MDGCTSARLDRERHLHQSCFFLELFTLAFARRSCILLLHYSHSPQSQSTCARSPILFLSLSRPDAVLCSDQTGNAALDHHSALFTLTLDNDWLTTLLLASYTDTLSCSRLHPPTLHAVISEQWDSETGHHDRTPSTPAIHHHDTIHPACSSDSVQPSLRRAVPATRPRPCRPRTAAPAWIAYQQEEGQQRATPDTRIIQRITMTSTLLTRPQITPAHLACRPHTAHRLDWIPHPLQATLDPSCTLHLHMVDYRLHCMPLHAMLAPSLPPDSTVLAPPHQTQFQALL